MDTNMGGGHTFVQRKRGKRRRLPILTEHDHPQIIPIDDGEPSVRSGVEPPLQHVPLNDQRPVDTALPLSLFSWADVHEKDGYGERGVVEFVECLARSDALELCACC
jgi:hypothetical protein